MPRKFNIIVGLGGTGEKCASALIHDICVGNVDCTKEDVFKFILIDKDSKCATLSECTSLISKYQQFRANYTEKLPTETTPQFARPKIELSQWDIDAMINPAGSANNNITVKQAVVTNNQGQDQQLLDMIYSDDEQDKGLQNGFYGHPTLGATVFRYAMKNYKGRGNTYLPVVNEAIAANTAGNNIEIRVFIFGSIFGGNGASILPNIAREISAELTAAGFAAGRFKIGGALILPFFRIPTLDSDGNRVPDYAFKISEDTFMRKTIESLRYYESAKIVKSQNNQNGCFDRLYLLGNMPFDFTSDNYADGGSDQNPHFHLINMLAANAACDFFNTPVADLNAAAQPNNLYIDRIAQRTAGEVNTFNWSNLAGEIAQGGKGKKDRYLKMACLAEFYTGYMYPQFFFRLGDDALMNDSKEVAVLYGRNGVFHRRNNCDSGQFNALKDSVNATNAYLEEYITYLYEVANTGIDWSNLANRGTPYCNLFNSAHLGVLKTAVDDARQGRDNAIHQLPNNLTLLGNIDNEIADVVNTLFTTADPGRNGLYGGNYARLVDAIYGSFLIG